MFKKLLPLLIFASTYFFIELHWFFPDNDKVFNWIWLTPKPMNLAWNVAYVANQVIVPFLRALAVYTMFGQLKVKRIFLLEIRLYMLFTILDGISYFVWFRTGDEFSILYWILSIAAAIWWCNSKNCNEKTTLKSSGNEFQ